MSPGPALFLLPLDRSEKEAVHPRQVTQHKQRHTGATHCHCAQLLVAPHFLSRYLLSPGMCQGYNTTVDKIDAASDALRNTVRKAVKVRREGQEICR